MNAATSLVSIPVERVSQRGPVAIIPLVAGLPATEAAAWDAYVLEHPDATLYHLHAWRRVAERAYGLDAPFLVARDRRWGAIRGVLPLFRIPRPFSPYLTNGLFGAYGHVLADGPRYARALVGAAVNRVARGRADYLHLKLLGQTSWPLLEKKNIWVTARLALSTDEEATWRSLPTAMRTKIRRAQKAGFVAGRYCDLGGFYEVLSENMLRKGAPIYGRGFFDSLLRELGARANVLTLSRDWRVVSGAFLAWVNGIMYVPFASSRPEVFSLKANQLLWWEIIRYAHALGLTTVDFGSSMRDSTGLEFKKYWRARIEPIESHLYVPRGVQPVLVPDRSRVAQWTVGAWSHLPPGLAETLGPRVARWIA